MGEMVAVPGRGTVEVGKNRNPLAVIFFGIITFGIYTLYWYYQVNAEIKRHEPIVKVSPGWAVVALFVPFANLVSLYNTATRVQKMELADGSTNTISPLVTFILLFFFGIGYFVQIQSHLDAHWDGHRFAAARANQIPQGAQQPLPPAVGFQPAALPQAPAAAHAEEQQPPATV